MALKAEYDSIEDVPEVHRELYSERGGKYVVTGIEGIALPGDVRKLKDENGGWRIKHRDATSALSSWQSLRNHEGAAFEKPEDVQALLDGIPSLKSAAEAGGSKSAEAVKKQVEEEAKRIEGKYQRQINEAGTKVSAAEKRIQNLENQQRQAFVHAFVQKQIADSKIGKVRPSAVEDILLYADRHLTVVEERDEDGNLVFKDVRTKSGAGVTEDVDVAAWLGEMQQRKGHWYEDSEGAGSGNRGRGGAGGGSNPWSKEGWSKTAQGQYARQYGLEKAAAMARAAGTWIGASAPGEKDPKA